MLNHLSLFFSSFLFQSEHCIVEWYENKRGRMVTRYDVCFRLITKEKFCGISLSMWERREGILLIVVSNIREYILIPALRFKNILLLSSIKIRLWRYTGKANSYIKIYRNWQIKVIFSTKYFKLRENIFSTLMLTYLNYTLA